MTIEASRNPFDNKRAVNQGMNCDFDDSFVGVGDNKWPNSEGLGLLFMSLNTAIFNEKAGQTVEVLVPDTAGNSVGEVGTDVDSQWHVAILSWMPGSCIRHGNV